LPKSKDKELTPSIPIYSYPKFITKGIARKYLEKVPTKKRTKASISKKILFTQLIKADRKGASN